MFKLALVLVVALLSVNTARASRSICKALPSSFGDYSGPGGFDMPLYDPLDPFSDFTIEARNCAQDANDVLWKIQSANGVEQFHQPSFYFDVVPGQNQFTNRGVYFVNTLGELDGSSYAFMVGKRPDDPVVEIMACSTDQELETTTLKVRIDTIDNDPQGGNKFFYNFFLNDSFEIQYEANNDISFEGDVNFPALGGVSLGAYVKKDYNPGGGEQSTFFAGVSSDLVEQELGCTGKITASAPPISVIYSDIAYSNITYTDSEHTIADFSVVEEPEQGTISVSTTGSITYTAGLAEAGEYLTRIKVSNDYGAFVIIDVPIYVHPTACPTNQSQIDSLKKRGIVVTHDSAGQTCGPGPNQNELDESIVTCSILQLACANPVNVSSGSVWHENVDFSVNGRTPESKLALARHYTASATTAVGDFGPNWRHGWESKLVFIKGDKVMWIDPMGGPWTYKKVGSFYAKPGGLTARLYKISDHYEVRDPAKKTYHYDLAGRLAKIVDLSGEETTLAYDPGGKLLSVTVPLAGTVSFTRNAEGRIASAKRERDNLTYTYTYDQDGRLSLVTDFSGFTYEYKYVTDMPGTAAQGMLASIKDPINRTIKLTYTPEGRAFQQFEPGGGTWTFQYAENTASKKKKKKALANFTRSTQVTRPDGQVLTYFFDSRYRLMETRDQLGRKKENIWNSQGYLMGQKDELGYTTSYNYDQWGNLSFIQKPGDSNPTYIEYLEDFDLPKRIITPAGGETKFLRDSNTGVIKKITEVGFSGPSLEIDYTLDTFGNVLSTNNGRATYTNQRNTDGLLTLVDSLHNSETRTYDARARLSTRTFQSGRVIQFTYDDYDRIVLIADSHGPEVENSYDPMGRLVSQTITDGSNPQTTSYAWDDHDRLKSMTDAVGRTTTYAYDPTRLLNFPSYVRDPAGQVTKFSYDSRGKLIEKSDPKGAITRFEYNERGDLISVIDANGNVTSYSYDGNGRVVEESRPSVLNGASVQRKINFQYNGDSRISREEHVSASGGDSRVIEYFYDEFDRMVRKTLSKGSILEDEVTYSYESQIDAKLLKSVNNGAADLSFSNEAAPPFSLTGFNVAGKSGNPFGLIEGDFDIARDITGNIAGVSGGGLGQIYSKAYDSAGRLLAVEASGFKASLAYDAFGRKNRITYSDGTSGLFSYDPLNRIIEINWKEKYKDSVRQQLTYDLAGNVTRMAREHSTYDLSYDPADQLVKSVFKGLQGVPNYTKSWELDSLGSRIGGSDGPGTFVSNFLTQNGASSFTADPDGFGQVVQEVTGDQVKNYTYRADGKVASFSSGALSVNYHYDGLDRLVAKTINENGNTYTQSFSHLGSEDRILLGKAGDGSVSTYIDGQGPLERLGEVKSGVGKGYITDHLGSVVNSAPAGSWKVYGLYGEPTGKVTLSPTASPVVHAFAGGRFNPESGNTTFGVRDLDHRTGRWLSQDPMGFDGGDAHYYKYVFDNPLKYTDPNGRFAVPVWVGWVMVGAWAVNQVQWFMQNENPEPLPKMPNNNGGVCSIHDTGPAFVPRQQPWEPLWGQYWDVLDDDSPIPVSSRPETYPPFTPVGPPMRR